MNLVFEIRQRLRHIWGPIITTAVIGYFLYHAVQGDRSLLAFISLRKQLNEAQMQLETVKTKREKLENRVKQMRPQNINPDILDEQVRSVLGVSNDREIIIPRANDNASE